MKQKLISINIILVFIFTTILSVNAIAVSPVIELDEYQITSKTKDNLYVEGTVSISKGQIVALYDSTCTMLYNYQLMPNSNKEESFKIKVPASYLKEGENVFKVKSLPVKGVINSSNPKPFTVIIKSTKKDQTITANDLILKVGESKNINAKVSSNLKLSYKSNNTAIATVDDSGKVIGRSVGNTTVLISQAGNSEYNSVSKTIKITVKKSESTPTNKKDQTIDAPILRYYFADVNKTKNLNAKASSGLKLTYKSSNTKIATVSSTGLVTAKKPGITTIIISQSGNSIYKPAASKIVTIRVPDIKTDADISNDIMSVCKTQAKWMQHYTYDWGKWKPKTLARSKKYGTCVTYANCVLYRLGLMPEKKYMWQNGNKKVTNLNNIYKDYYGVSKSNVKKYLKVTYVSSKAKTLKNNGKLMKGDILYWGHGNVVGHGGHIMFFSHISKKGKPVVWDQGSGKNAGVNARSRSNYTMCTVVHLQRYTNKTSCTNGTITPSQRYLARPPKSVRLSMSNGKLKKESNKITISYSPINGKKLKSIKIDGKAYSITKYKNSYTFNKLDQDHTIEVIYE